MGLGFKLAYRILSSIKQGGGPASLSNLLLEDFSNILLEDGTYLLTEN